MRSEKDDHLWMLCEMSGEEFVIYYQILAAKFRKSAEFAFIRSRGIDFLNL